MPASVTILYATVSGYARALAGLAADRLRAAGCDVVVHNVADFPAGQLAACDTVLVFASTWGEGAPPPEAEKFCAALEPPATLPLAHLRFAVFALGSSKYEKFCACGRGIDTNLARCGAVRLLPCAESDAKHKSGFAAWLDQVAARIAAGAAEDNGH